MGIKRTIECDVCGAIAEEAAPNAGWHGWGALHGITLDGTDNPVLCPPCLGKVATFIDKEKQHDVD